MAEPNNIQAYLMDVVTGKKHGISVIPVLFALSCLEYIYRALLYVNRISVKAKSLPVPVISVGNVLVGGTGKTPTVVSIARLLIEAGYHPAVLTRGYRSSSEEQGLVFSSVDLEHLKPEDTGDEPNLLARLVPQLVVGVGRERCRIGHQVLANYPEIDLFLLDDGFQYWGLKRDLDIVLIDAINPFGNGHLLPRGLLREPLSALARAGLILITRSEQMGDQAKQAILSRIARYNNKAPVASVATENSELMPLNGEPNDLNSLVQTKVAVITAIGNPEQFQKSVAANGAEIAHFRSYPDHHYWTNAEIGELIDEMRAKDLSVMVVTAKDGVKLSRFAPVFKQAGVRCYMLQLDFIIPQCVTGTIKRAASARRVK